MSLLRKRNILLVLLKVHAGFFSLILKKCLLISQHAWSSFLVVLPRRGQNSAAQTAQKQFQTTLLMKYSIHLSTCQNSMNQSISAQTLMTIVRHHHVWIQKAVRLHESDMKACISAFWMASWHFGVGLIICGHRPRGQFTETAILH